MDFYTIDESYIEFLKKYEKEHRGSTKVPDMCIKRLIIKEIEDEKYRLLVNKEYRFCKENEERIHKKDKPVS